MIVGWEDEENDISGIGAKKAAAFEGPAIGGNIERPTSNIDVKRFKEPGAG